MLLNTFLKQFIKVGTLNIRNSRGKTYVFYGTQTPQITLCLHSKSIERRLYLSPLMALGEGYMNEEFSIEQGNIFDFLMFCAENLQHSSLPIFETIKYRLFSPFLHSPNSIHKSQKNVAHHYDLSEDFYNLFLGRDMQYSCAYFRDRTDSLDTAQKNKKKHIAAKLHLRPGQKILDIGCGWGGLALSLARDKEVEVTGLTLSEEQLKIAKARAKQAGLENRIRFYLRDYRQETKTYDRIVSIGMFEHVGKQHYPEFFKKISSLLKENGLALLHSIGCSTGPTFPNPWLNKYIFPGGYSPALSETLAALEASKLYVTDVEILHHHYAETLCHWRNRFMANQEIIIQKWGKHFLHMWEYYLASCEVAFRKRGYMVFQIQMVKNPDSASLTRDYIYEKERKFVCQAVPNHTKTLKNLNKTRGNNFKSF